MLFVLPGGIFNRSYLLADENQNHQQGNKIGTTFSIFSFAHSYLHSMLPVILQLVS